MSRSSHDTGHSCDSRSRVGHISTMQRISFLGMELDSVSQTARLTQERAQLVLICLKTLSGRTAVHPQAVQLIWGRFGVAQVDLFLWISRNHPLPVVLFPNRGNALHGCTGTQLAPGPAQICVPPNEPTSTDTPKGPGSRNSCSSRQPLPGRFL